MFGFRYHVATLCAMFLMLGIGFIIGSTSSLGPAVIKQQTSTIQSLSTRVDDLLKEGEHDHNMLRQNQQALAALVPRLVAGKLAGKRIAIIRTGDYADAAQAAADAIAAAGGAVTSTTTLTNRLQILDASQRGKVMSDLGISADPTSADALQQLLHPLAAVIRVGTTARPDLQDELGTLDQDGVIDRSGDYSAPVNVVVVVGGELTTSGDAGSEAADGDDPVAAAMVTDLLATAGPAVVGCEPVDADISSIAEFDKAGIATVDCVDLPLGALDLPYAVRGDAAAYGVKPTATRLIPASLEAAGQSSTDPSASPSVGTGGEQ